MTRLSPEFRRILAVLLLLLAILAAFELLVAPLVSLHREFDLAWRNDAVQLAHYGRIAGALDALQEARAQLQADEAGPLPYVTADSEALAIADLQERVKQVVESSGAQLIGTRVLEPQAEGGFTRFGLRITLSASLPPLQATLYQLEAELPVLFVDDLSIQRHDRDQGGVASSADPLLDVAFDLLAYRKEPT